MSNVHMGQMQDIISNETILISKYLVFTNVPKYYRNIKLFTKYVLK